MVPNSVVDDSPISFPAGETGSQAWEPKNYDGKYDGPMSLRSALARSKNMVSIRLLKSIGPRYAQDYVTKFGFDAERHPAYLTMALGAGSVTPWQMLRGYSVFANGGYRVEPYLVKEIRDEAGNVLARVDPPVAGETAERTIDERNAYLMDSMLKDVVRRGTAAKALVLKRGDLAGKTGTHQRIRGRLVLRLPAHRGRSSLDRLRPAPQAGQWRNRRHRRPAHVDQLHAQGPRRRS